MRISAPSVASVGYTEPTDRFSASESGISRTFFELQHAESATVADVTLLRDTGMLYWFRVLSSALTGLGHPAILVWDFWVGWGDLGNSWEFLGILGILGIPGNSGNSWEFRKKSLHRQLHRLLHRSSDTRLKCTSLPYLSIHLVSLFNVFQNPFLVARVEVYLYQRPCTRIRNAASDLKTKL